MNRPITDGEVCVESIHGDAIVLFVEAVQDSTKAQVGVLDIDYEIRKTVLSLSPPTDEFTDIRSGIDKYCIIKNSLINLNGNK